MSSQAARSSGVSVISSTGRTSSSWASVRAPKTGAVMPGWSLHHSSAIWPGVFPACRANSTNLAPASTARRVTPGGPGAAGGGGQARRHNSFLNPAVEQVVGRLLADVARQVLALAHPQRLHDPPGRV